MAEETAHTGSGTPARVAYDLWDKLSNRSRQNGESQADYIQRQLAVYAECLNAARARTFDTTKLK